MRKIEEEMITAIQNRESWSKDNTSVIINGDEITVTLHGNIIAIKDYHGHWKLHNGNISYWNTVTTRSRLNALATIFNGSFGGVSCKKGVLYIHTDITRQVDKTNYTFIGK